MVVNLVILMGNVVSPGGRGMDSMRVSLARGMVERRDAGKSAGEQPRMTCRRWEFDV